MEQLERLELKLGQSRAWQLVLVAAYAAMSIWFFWDLVADTHRMPTVVKIAAGIGSLIVLLNASAQLGARAQRALVAVRRRRTP